LKFFQDYLIHTNLSPLFSNAEFSLSLFSTLFQGISRLFNILLQSSLMFKKWRNMTIGLNVRCSEIPHFSNKIRLTDSISVALTNLIIRLKTRCYYATLPPLFFGLGYQHWVIFLYRSRFWLRFFPEVSDSYKILYIV
jgi:hypothetical protein